MMAKQIYAYTGASPSYPEYLNVAVDGDVLVTVRGPIRINTGTFDMPGHTGVMRLPLAELPQFIAALSDILSASKRAHQDEDDGA